MLTPENLLCEYFTNPLGLDVPQPRLSWQVHSAKRGARQTAYQIIVAQEPGAFESLSTEQNEFGVILKDAVAFLNAEVKDQWVLGDHVVLQCLVHEGKMLREDIQPWVHVRKNGFNY